MHLKTILYIIILFISFSSLSIDTEIGFSDIAGAQRRSSFDSDSDIDPSILDALYKDEEEAKILEKLDTREKADCEELFSSYCLSERGQVQSENLLGGAQEELFVYPEKIHSYFSKISNIRNLLVSLVDHENTNIKIAMYMFTDPALFWSLIRAKKRGVNVKLILDQSSIPYSRSSINNLLDYDIDVEIYDNSNGIMHHKFMILRALKKLCVGSFNFTNNANERNEENLLVIEDEEAIKDHESEFKRLKKNIIKMCTKRRLQ